MSDTAYIVLAWAGTFGAIAVYSWSLLRRGRRLSRQVPEEERRWM